MGDKPAISEEELVRRFLDAIPKGADPAGGEALVKEFLSAAPPLDTGRKPNPPLLLSLYDRLTKGVYEGPPTDEVRLDDADAEEPPKEGAEEKGPAKDGEPGAPAIVETGGAPHAESEGAGATPQSGQIEVKTASTLADAKAHTPLATSDAGGGPPLISIIKPKTHGQVLEMELIDPPIQQAEEEVIEAELVVEEVPEGNPAQTSSGEPETPLSNDARRVAPPSQITIKQPKAGGPKRRQKARGPVPKPKAAVPRIKSRASRPRPAPKRRAGGPTPRPRAGEPVPKPKAAGPVIKARTGGPRPEPAGSRAGYSTMVLDYPARCDICLGMIKPGWTIIRCDNCGKHFHESCAKQVGRCLLCGQGWTFEVGEEPGPAGSVPAQTRFGEPETPLSDDARRVATPSQITIKQPKAGGTKPGPRAGGPVPKPKAKSLKPEAKRS